MTEISNSHKPNRSLIFGVAHVALLGVCILAAASTILLRPRPVHAELTALSRGLRNEYAVPGGPVNIALEAPGRIWFTAPAEDAIGQLIVTSPLGAPIITYVVNFIVLAPGSDPYDIEYLDGAVYFTERSGNRIGRIDVNTRELKEYPIPTPNSAPTGIDAAPNGTLWFVERDGKKLVNFNPQTEEFHEHPFVGEAFARRDAGGRDVAVQDDDTVWFTAPGVNVVYAYFVSLGQFFDIPTGFIALPGEPGQPDVTIATNPSNLVIDSSGRPWVTAIQANLVGRYAPGTLALWNWRTPPTPNSGPAAIAFRRNGSVLEFWFSQSNVGQVGRQIVSPSGIVRQIIEYPLSSRTSRPWGIAIDDNLSVWVAETDAGLITELRPPYSYEMYMPLSSR